MEFKTVSMVGVAQLVEPWIVAPVVEGSNPFAHPIARLRKPLRSLLSLGGAWVKNDWQKKGR